MRILRTLVLIFSLFAVVGASWAALTGKPSPGQLVWTNHFCYTEAQALQVLEGFKISEAKGHEAFFEAGCQALGGYEMVTLLSAVSPALDLPGRSYQAWSAVADLGEGHETLLLFTLIPVNQETA